MAAPRGRCAQAVNATEFRVDTRSILVEVGCRKEVGWHGNVIVDVNLDIISKGHQ